MPESKVDPRVQNFGFDVDVDMKVEEKLAEMGIKSADDLGMGRADVGLISRHIEDRIDPQLDPELMDNARRDADWAREAGSPEQPAARTATTEPATQQPESPADRLAQLQAELESRRAEADDWKRKYGERENKLGEERKRTAERLARLESSATGTAYAPPNVASYQPAGYDPRILGGVDPDAPLTAGQTASLLQSMAAAFGSQLSARDNQIIEAAKQLRNYDLTSNEEADLIERHGWLAALDRTSQISAMRDLVQPLRAASKPAADAPIKPRGVDMLELARQKHLTATTFIEPSSRGSVQETQAATGVDSALAKKIAEYKDALRKRPGDAGVEFDSYNANKTAERLLIEINALQRRR
jgi:hypothetical protein